MAPRFLVSQTATSPEAIAPEEGVEVINERFWVERFVHRFGSVQKRDQTIYRRA